MPLVKPMTTGRGMKRTALPSPVTPMNSSMTPAIMVTISRPDKPNLAMMPATITTKAPVGPPIWIRDPPKAEIEEAADDGGVDSGLRRDAGRDAERHRQRQRDQADGDAGDQVGEKGGAVVGSKALEELRPQSRVVDLNFFGHRGRRRGRRRFA